LADQGQLSQLQLPWPDAGVQQQGETEADEILPEMKTDGRFQIAAQSGQNGYGNHR
jgi:hypothetical protein